MQNATETLQKAIVAGRIRDSLRAIGYAVPEGTGLGSPAVLAAMAPAIRDLTVKLGPVFGQRMQEEKDPVARATLFAEAAEGVARRQRPGVPASVMQTVGALAAGFAAYRTMKKKAGGRMENISLGDFMSLFGMNLTAHGRR